jgi:hypothetical protein
VAGQVRFAYGANIGPATPADTAGPPNYERLLAGRTHLPLGDGRVSVVFADLPTEFLAPWEFNRHLREVSRVLVPGGAYVFHTARRGAASPDGAVPAHGHRGYTFGELAERFHAAGFDAVGVRIRVGGRYLSVPGWAVRLAEAVRGRPFDTVTVVAWKETRCLAYADLPVDLRVGLA